MSVIYAEILTQPEHGHVSVNPDKTLSFVGTMSDYIGDISFTYRVQNADGSIEERTKALTITESPQASGWGTGENHYMLPVDADTGRVVIEHGENHRKIYVSPNGLTAADIVAMDPDVSEDDVQYKYMGWLKRHPQYGGSKDMAVVPDLGFALWWDTNRKLETSSHWLMLERGYEYDINFPTPEGESPLHPLFIGAFGAGKKPKIAGQYQSNGNTKHVVIQDVDFSGGFSMLGVKQNILFDNVDAKGEASFQSTGGTHTGITLRRTAIKDSFKERPVGEHDGKWAAINNRDSGLYITGVTGFLFDGVFFDHNGFAPDFLPDGSVEGGHPPSMYSHNLYAQGSVLDATLRDSILMRGASFGAQFRGGAYVTDTVFLDNNIPLNVLGGNYKGRGPTGQYSLLDGNLVTSAAWRGRDRETGQRVPKIGAVNWGIRNSALLTTLVDNLVVHANDPNNEEDTRSSKSAVKYMTDHERIYYNDTVVWRWGWGGEKENDQDARNVEGRDPDKMNATTIERYKGSVEGFADYIRSLDSAEYAAAAQDILAYFRAGFGIEQATRESAATLRFVPDMRGDGVRWDNRLNWDSGDLPGSVAGDSVDLGGNRVVYPALTSNINDLTFGKFGSLTINSGKLTVSGVLDGGKHAKIRIGNAGQFWFGSEVSTSPISVNVTGGRFCNTGAFNGPSETVASGGQMILATHGATFELLGALEIRGTEAKVGFDGLEGEASLAVAAASKITFVADADGVAPIRKFRTGAFEDNAGLSTFVDLAGELVVDLAAYEGGPQVVTLIDADNLTGSFASTDVVNVPDGLTARVTQTETNVELVIE